MSVPTEPQPDWDKLFGNWEVDGDNGLRKGDDRIEAANYYMPDINFPASLEWLRCLPFDLQTSLYIYICLRSDEDYSKPANMFVEEWKETKKKLQEIGVLGASVDSEDKQ